MTASPHTVEDPAGPAGPRDWPRWSPPALVLDREPREGVDVLVLAVRPVPRSAGGAGQAPEDGTTRDWLADAVPAVDAAVLARHGLLPAAGEQTAVTPAALAVPPDWAQAWQDFVPTPSAPVTGRDGEVVTVAVPPAAPLPFDTLVLLGLGPGLGDGTTAAQLRRAAATLGRQLRSRRKVTLLLPELEAASVRALSEGWVLGAYRAPALRSTLAPAATTSPREDEAPGQVVALDLPGDQDVAAAATALGLAHARATAGARDLAVTPSNVKNPGWLAGRARELAADPDRPVAVRIREVDALRAEGFGGILAVGAGSATPPVLIELDHVPVGGDPAQPPIVLVGKGITFDTGGLSIKPRESMLSMKTDMSGAAVVLEVLRACAATAVPRRVVGLLPVAENAFGAASYRPSDVVTHYGGRTVEVANTDAEGRMVLADALAYAVARLAPVAVVDIATLTGAVTLGLGKRHAALFGEDEALLAGLERAGEASGERVWRMPLVEDYLPALDSSVAQLRHVPEKAVWGGGSITAALFLREFARGVAWAHLDIAGVGRADKDEYEVCRGATGWGARLLLRWIEDVAGPDGVRGPSPDGLS